MGNAGRETPPLVEYHILKGMRFSAHPNVPKSVSAVLQEIGQDPKVEELILFGSRAFGDHQSGSDVDVAIKGDLTREEWISIKDIANQGRSLYWISLVHLNTSPQELRNRIVATGTTLYVRT